MHLVLVCVFFDCVANRKGICLRERQTSNEGLRQHSCQWEMGSSDESLFQALIIIALPSMLLHLVIGESRCHWNTWFSSMSPSWVAPACGKCIQCYPAAGVCWASWPCCVFDPPLPCTVTCARTGTTVLKPLTFPYPYLNSHYNKIQHTQVSSHPNPAFPSCKHDLTKHSSSGSQIRKFCLKTKGVDFKFLEIFVMFLLLPFWVRLQL